MILQALLLATTISAGTAPSGATISIDTRDANHWIGANVTVQTWNQNRISIDQDVERGKPSDVQAEITRSPDRIAIVAQYTGERKSWLFGLIRSTDGKFFRWVVHVPAGRRVNVREANGRLEIDGVRAPLDVATSNGNITISGAGPVLSARTSNGTIAASIATLAGGPPDIRLRSSNGGIHLNVPAHFTTRIEAETSNGDVTNPFRDASGPGSASVHTSNGSIEVTGGS
jgi:hypothetical protein